MTGYLGPAGTFSHQAAAECAQGGELQEFKTIYSLILAVADGSIDKAVLPIENSIEGSVNATLDTLAFDVDLYITGEYILKIRENLMALPGTKKEGIKKIISHPQPIGQCSKMLEREFGGILIDFSDSTASAAETVKNDTGDSAVIGPESCGRLYGLEILIPNCADELNNSTRFVIVERERSKAVTPNDKTSIVFMLNDTPGSLYSALELFSKYKINMIKIESRPSKRELGKYVFFIDIDGNIDDANIYFALDKLKQHTLSYKFLGSYKKA